MLHCKHKNYTQNSNRLILCLVVPWQCLGMILLHSLCVVLYWQRVETVWANCWLWFCQNDASHLRQDGLRKRSLTQCSYTKIHADTIHDWTQSQKEKMLFNKEKKNVYTVKWPLAQDLTIDHIFLSLQLSMLNVQELCLPSKCLSFILFPNTLIFTLRTMAARKEKIQYNQMWTAT